MTEIPEHLRKRAEEARRRAQAKQGGGEPSETPASPPTGQPAAAAEPEAPKSEAASRIPAHLLERSRAAKARAEAVRAPESTSVLILPPLGAHDLPGDGQRSLV